MFLFAVTLPFNVPKNIAALVGGLIANFFAADGLFILPRVEQGVSDDVLLLNPDLADNQVG